MKNLIFVTTLLVVFAVTTLAAGHDGYRKSVSGNSVDNYLEGLESQNFGLKLSAAYYLGEYGCQDAVIPLLRMLKSDKRVEARIAAAVALFKLNDDRGLYAVKEAIKFDDSKRVRKICSLLYHEHLKPVKQDSGNLAKR